MTMLQRSLSYLFNLATVDAIVGRLRRWLPPARLKNVLIGMAFLQLARRRP